MFSATVTGYSGPDPAVTESLFQAVRDDDVAELQKLFKEYPLAADPNAEKFEDFGSEELAELLIVEALRCSKECFDCILSHEKLDVNKRSHIEYFDAEGKRRMSLSNSVFDDACTGLNDRCFWALLERADVDLNLTDPCNKGQTAIWTAVFSGWNGKIVRAVVDDPRFDPFVTDTDGRTVRDKMESWHRRGIHPDQRFGHVPPEQMRDLLRWMGWLQGREESDAFLRAELTALLARDGPQTERGIIWREVASYAFEAPPTPRRKRPRGGEEAAGADGDQSRKRPKRTEEEATEADGENAPSGRAWNLSRSDRGKETEGGEDSRNS